MRVAIPIAAHIATRVATRIVPHVATQVAIRVAVVVYASALLDEDVADEEGEAERGDEPVEAAARDRARRREADLRPEQQRQHEDAHPGHEAAVGPPAQPCARTGDRRQQQHREQLQQREHHAHLLELPAVVAQRRVDARTHPGAAREVPTPRVGRYVYRAETAPPRRHSAALDVAASSLARSLALSNRIARHDARGKRERGQPLRDGRRALGAPLHARRRLVPRANCDAVLHALGRDAQCAFGCACGRAMNYGFSCSVGGVDRLVGRVLSSILGCVVGCVVDCVVGCGLICVVGCVAVRAVPARARFRARRRIGRLRCARNLPYAARLVGEQEASDARGEGCDQRRLLLLVAAVRPLPLGRVELDAVRRLDGPMEELVPLPRPDALRVHLHIPFSPRAHQRAAAAAAAAIGILGLGFGLGVERRPKHPSSDRRQQLLA
eukprot:3378975-Pleurochrysis_carterae.AAC.1